MFEAEQDLRPHFTTRKVIIRITKCNELKFQEPVLHRFAFVVPFLGLSRSILRALIFIFLTILDFYILGHYKAFRHVETLFV